MRISDPRELCQLGFAIRACRASSFVQQPKHQINVASHLGISPGIDAILGARRAYLLISVSNLLSTL